MTTATKASVELSQFWLNKTLEVGVLTSQSLNIVHPHFKAKMLMNISKTIVYTSHKLVHSQPTVTISHCNDNKLLDYHQCLEHFAIIKLALNFGPVVSIYGRYLHVSSRISLLEIIILRRSLDSRIISS